MKADFSRSTFDRANHYKRVLLQQGRAQTEADGNEQQAITLHRMETEAADLIGGCGGPIHAAGFAVTPDGDDLLIGAGRYYAGGVLCENEEELPYSEQPDYPLDAAFLAHLDEPPVTIPPEPGVYVAYLDVWERHLTALEAPHIREVALGGPDTATRSKALWQVKLHPLTEDDPADADCLSEIPSWEEATAPSTGELSARADVAAASDDPCVVMPGAGYRRLENQLYRVEVHEGGTRNASSFKWDRDNGTIVAHLEDQSTDLTEWTVSSVGRDGVLRFAPGDLVELTDDARDLHGLPGTLVRVDVVEGNVITVDLSAPIPAGGSVDMADFPASPKVRRWNGILEGVTSQAFQDLEDGVQVRLRGGTGADGATRRYRTGDYWVVPARTNTGDVEWPTENDGWRLAAGIHHHYCRLALVEFEDPGGWADPVDCRSLFPPVTELTSLFYVGGDGQECMPGEELPLALSLGVANGMHPVGGARVRFSVTSGSAEIAETSGGAGADTLELSTDAEGRVECFWTPDAGPLTVDAELLDAGGDPVHVPVRFGANLSTADAVAYTPAGGCVMPDTVTTVQAALDELCMREGTACAVTIGPGPEWEARAQASLAAADDLHLCFQAGSYPLTAPLLIQEKGHVTITGCGPATRFSIADAETVFDAEACASVRFADFHAEAGHAGDASDREEAEHLNGVVNIVGCGAATVERVSVRCEGGVRRAVTGITVRDGSSGDGGADGPHSTRIRGCTVGIGHRQTGILVVNVERALVEDNHLFVTGRSPEAGVADVLAGDAHLRATLGDVMLAELRLSREPGRRRQPGSEMRRRLLKAGLLGDAVEVRATLAAGPNQFHASFFAPAELAEPWQDLIEAHPLSSGGRSADSVVQHLETLRTRILQGVLAGPEAESVVDWLDGVITSNPPVASQGIVVAKNRAAEGDPPSPDVRIVHNRIAGCQQGVHVGASHRAPPDGEAGLDYTDTVMVAGNTIDVTLSPETSRERHGVFVGNAWHVAVQDNRIRVGRTSAGGVWRIEGIRLWGCFGPLVIARQNHIDGATVGIRANPLDDSCWPPQRHWYIADNVAPGATAAVDAGPPFVEERNVP